jgi:ubiquinone/menaquinone biosynthesis C-methylase UbiE
MMSDNPSAVPPELMARFIENVRGSVPLGIEQIDVMLRLIEAARGKVQTFLDLGCGEGVLSAAILGDHPEAHGILVELSEPMLRLAREHLRPFADRTEFVVADFHEPGWAYGRLRGPFDAIISGFALHAIPDERKPALYAELYQLLHPEGIFIRFDHVASATRWTESVWDDYIIDAIFGSELKSTPNRPRADIAREYYRKSAKAGNVPPPLEVECDWLRNAGFENVDCFHKVHELAMFGGQKTGGRGGDE